MRLICGVVGTVAAAAFAVSAHALDLPPLPPLPTVPLPTVPLPTVPVPTVPAPTVPAPPLPAPTVPTPTVPTPTVPAAPAPRPAPASAPQQATPQPPPSTPAAPGTATTAPAPAQAASQPTVVGTARGQTARTRRAASRPRVLGHFRLAQAGRVRVTVRELAPVCRTLRAFRLKARKGQNTLHLPSRIKRPGSYEFVGRAHGHKLFTVHARIARGRRVLLGATTSVCAAPSAPVPFASIVSERPVPQLHVKHATARSTLPPTIASPPSSGSPLVRAVSLKDAPASVRPLLFALLALAILLLATAAAPQQVLPTSRAAAVIATRRTYLAAAGIALLVVVAVVTAAS